MAVKALPGLAGWGKLVMFPAASYVGGVAHPGELVMAVISLTVLWPLVALTRDGASRPVIEEAWDAIEGRTAWSSQVPMIRKWIVYMAILAFAAGTQLFVEPQLLQTASLGRVNPTWSPNQLGYIYAFQRGDFNGAAAASIFLLALGLICAGILVTRSGLFKADDK